jgi:hypothetical protein
MEILVRNEERTSIDHRSITVDLGSITVQSPMNRSSIARRSIGNRTPFDGSVA